MAKNIFRKVSLERLRSPEQLDQLIKVTSVKAWIAIVAIFLLLITGIVWGVIGKIPTKINGQGILLTGGGIHNVVHTYGGKITDISASAGDRVELGDTIASIEQYSLINQIIILKESLNNIDNQMNKDDIKREINDLQAEYEYRTTITAPYSGKILEVKLNRGDILNPGEAIVSIEQSGAALRDLEGIIYVSAYDGKKLMPGMEVKISPSFVKKEEYGFIQGRVISVSEFPATYQRMMSVLGSQELVEMFATNGAPIEVRVELLAEQNNFSGLKWTSPDGPPVKINSGTLSTGSITIGSQRPIEMVIPIKIGIDE